MRGRAMCCWQYQPAATARNILCAIEAARECKAERDRSYRRKRRQDADGLRSLLVRADQIDAADSGNAHHDRPHDLRAFGEAARGGMKLNSANS